MIGQFDPVVTHVVDMLYNMTSTGEPFAEQIRWSQNRNFLADLNFKVCNSSSWKKVAFFGGGSLTKPGSD